MSFPFALVTQPDGPPYQCTCRIGVGPFVKTRHLLSNGDELFICKSCVAKIAVLFDYVLLSEFEAQTEQLQISRAHVLEVSNELDRVTRQLETGELQRLRDELEVARAERDSFSERAHRSERENEQLRNGEAASVLRESITEAVAAFAAPAKRATKAKEPA